MKWYVCLLALKVNSIIDFMQAWQRRLANRPILTGGIMLPNAAHGPLPRMKPQPVAIHGIIANRLRMRTNQQEKTIALKDDMEDLGYDIQNEYDAQVLSGLPKNTREALERQDRSEWSKFCLSS